jgi:hypothetical protein
MGEHGISRFSCMEIPCMQWFSDRAGSAGSSRIALPAMLPSGLVNGVGTLNSLISRLNSPACTYPFQRFASVLTDVDAWFGATVDRYSFDVGLSHSFLHAGLSRRSNYSGVGSTG